MTPAFNLFYTDGILFANINALDMAESEEFTKEAETELNSLKLKYIHAIEEYIFFKQRARIEYQIMEANRVGVEKNMAHIISQTA